MRSMGAESLSGNAFPSRAELALENVALHQCQICNDFPVSVQSKINLYVYPSTEEVSANPKDYRMRNMAQRLGVRRNGRKNLKKKRGVPAQSGPEESPLSA